MELYYYILELLSGWNLSFILVSLVLTFFWVRSRRPVDIPPGPRPFPFIGNLTSLFGSDLLQTNRKLKEKYGSIYSLSLGPYWAVFINDSNLLHEVFVKHADNFSDRPDVFFFKTMLNGKGEYTALLYNSLTNIGLFL